MGKFLAIFNVVAGGASIAGLYATLVMPYDSRMMVALFGITAVLCGYVLFVPGNPIEKNVTSKLKHYRYPQSGTTVSIQEGEFTVNEGNLLPILFPHPYAVPPAVELIKLGGHPQASVHVAAVSPHQFEIGSLRTIFSHEKLIYRWIAKGTLLEEIQTPKG